MNSLQRTATVALLCSFACTEPALRATQKDFGPGPLVTTDPIPRAGSAGTAAANLSPPPPRQSQQPTSSTYTRSLSTQAQHAISSETPANLPAVEKGGPPSAQAELLSSAAVGEALDFNEIILRTIKKMPHAGSYSVSAKANANLRRAIVIDESGALAVHPDAAKPSFCSGATYLVFLMALQDLEKSGQLKLGKNASERFLHKSQPDGAGVWGRWNANGPGVARLFYELNAGENFSDLAKAKPGDFLKVWWTDEIGAKERGHMVVYLGHRSDESGEQLLRFWSSNIPDGYGAKEIPLSKAKRMLFSRLLRPEALRDAPSLPAKDEFLASMLTKSFSMEEVLDMTGSRSK